LGRGIFAGSILNCIRFCQLSQNAPQPSWPRGKIIPMEWFPLPETRLPHAVSSSIDLAGVHSSLSLNTGSSPACEKARPVPFINATGLACYTLYLQITEVLPCLQLPLAHRPGCYHGSNSATSTERHAYAVGETGESSALFPAPFPTSRCAA
jgi:hypothetical protein